MKARDIVRSLQGPAALSAQLSNRAKPISADAVQKWCERGAIPPRWYVHLLAIAEQADVRLSLEDLSRASGDGNASTP